MAGDAPAVQLIRVIREIRGSLLLLFAEIRLICCQLWLH
jgi:hypothetical protein